MYIKVKNKLEVSLFFSALWFVVAFYLALPWTHDLSQLVTPAVAWFIVAGLALVPGIAMSFIIAALIFDHRPEYKVPVILPDISILIAAYNEEEYIEKTLESICIQNVQNLPNLSKSVMIKNLGGS